MQVTTGFGYFTLNGNIIGKAELPIGTHPDPNNGATYTEVADQVALDAITVYQKPLTPAQVFNVDTFCQALFTSFSADSNLFPYYAVLKDLATFQNFVGMNGIVNALLAANILNQTEVTSLNSILASQNIVLATFTP